MENDLCARRENYEKEDAASDYEQKKTQDEEELGYGIQIYKQPEQEQHEEISSQKLYKQEAEKTLHSSSTLLLPAVKVPEETHETFQEIKAKLPLSNLSGVDSLCVITYIQDLEEKTSEALHKAKHYRDLAEKLRGECLNNQYIMEKKVEQVRSFWRNSIGEGSTRAGLMVRRAVQRTKKQCVQEVI